MSTKTTKKILSPTNNRINNISSSTITTRTTRKRISSGGGSSSISGNIIQTRSKSKNNELLNNLENEEYEEYEQQQDEINELRDNQLYELEELEEQQLNEIEQLTNERRISLSSNTRLKNLFKVLITILVFSIIYGVYTNQFQPKPVEPFHLTEPIGHTWMEQFIDKSNHWLQLWKNSYKELTRVLPLPESETLPAGHQLHEKNLYDNLNSYQEKKRIQKEMEKLRDQDYNNYKHHHNKDKDQFNNYKTTTDNNDQQQLKKRNGPPLYQLDERIKKEIERQLKPHPAQYPPKDYNRQLENEKLQQHQHSIPSHHHHQDNTFYNIEESIKDNLEQAVYKIEEKSKELLNNIEEKKDQIKNIINQQKDDNPIQKEIDQLISSIEKANYNILDNIKDKITEPTIENLNQLKYKINDAARESREQFKYKFDQLKENEKEFIEQEKKKFGPQQNQHLNVKPIC